MQLVARLGSRLSHRRLDLGGWRGMAINHKQVSMAPSSKRAAPVRRAALEPERRILPLELDVAAP
jgi:hypothetical protein